MYDLPRLLQLAANLTWGLNRDHGRRSGSRPRSHRRRMALACAVTAAILLLAPARGHAGTILFYGGDFDPTTPGILSNERNTAVAQSNVYQNFIVPAGQSWNVSALLSNDFVTPGISFVSADWSIRAGVSSANAGTLIAGGNSPVTITPTGRTGFSDIENTFEVAGLSIHLSPGTYWLNVTPVGTGSGRSWNSNTSGINAVGSDVAYDQFFNSPSFGDNYSPTLPPFANFSDGVIGTATPEPTGLVLALSGLTTGAGYCGWRRLRLGLACSRRLTLARI
jgi:hypothetical protein